MPVFADDLVRLRVDLAAGRATPYSLTQTKPPPAAAAQGATFGGDRDLRDDDRRLPRRRQSTRRAGASESESEDAHAPTIVRNRSK